MSTTYTGTLKRNKNSDSIESTIEISDIEFNDNIGNRTRRSYYVERESRINSLKASNQK